MRWLEKQSKGYDWLVVLSGQDYPVRPLVDLEEELAHSEYDGYFYHFEAGNESEASALPMRWSPALVDERYHFEYSVLKANPTFFDRVVWRMPREILARTKNYRLHTSFGIMLGSRPQRLPFTQDFKLYGGSYWLTINRRAVRAVLDFVDDHPEIVKYFRDIVVPEEVFLQTVLANNKDLRLSSRELRFYEFETGGHGHPIVIGMADLDRVMASGCYIARKFDMKRDPELLDEIDRRLLAATAAKLRAAQDIRPVSDTLSAPVTSKSGQVASLGETSVGATGIANANIGSS
jgi:hypothetical protein